eukprot:796930_1
MSIVNNIKIADAIKNGSKDSVHKTKDIEKFLDSCDKINFATFRDDETGLSIPSLCHLILPIVPSNMNSIYHESLFEMLKSCKIFEQFGIFDGILSIIAEFMKHYEFVLEYEEKPQSTYNANYYCDIKKVVLSKHMLSIDIEEHGDMSFGRLQYPIRSKLGICDNDNQTTAMGWMRMARFKTQYPLQYTSFFKYDIKYEVFGVLTYNIKELYKKTREQIFDIQFSYGSGGYHVVKLFNKENETHQKFIEDYLLYYN